jgi:hypothetical protein
MATLAEQLVNVQAAIEAAESAQSVSGGGRSRQMADLDTLYRRERDLLNRISLGSRPTTATWGTQAGSLSFMGKAVTKSGGFMRKCVSYKESETSIRLSFLLTMNRFAGWFNRPLGASPKGQAG